LIKNCNLLIPRFPYRTSKLKEKSSSLQMSRTYGVSIFIDYCTALASWRKLKGEERDTGLINMNEASSCLAWGYWVPHIPRKGSSAYQGPPPQTHTPHSRILAISGDLGQNRGRPPFRSLKVM
jgi:hypothetical protein